jgi:hypothetical protein
MERGVVVEDGQGIDLLLYGRGGRRQVQGGIWSTDDDALMWQFYVEEGEPMEGT